MDLSPIFPVKESESEKIERISTHFFSELDIGMEKDDIFRDISNCETLMLLCFQCLGPKIVTEKK